jgi:hypothetical protein
MTKPIFYPPIYRWNQTRVPTLAADWLRIAERQRNTARSHCKDSTMAEFWWSAARDSLSIVRTILRVADKGRAE